MENHSYIDPKELVSDREYQVLDKMRRGFVPKEISDLLKISVTTVRNHIASIKQKIGLNTDAEIEVI